LSIPAALGLLAQRSPTIEVIGATDYYTTAIFRQAHSAWLDGSGSSISCLFPNVELRLGIGLPQGSAVNAHLMCAAEHVDELDRALRELTFRGPEQRTYRCTPEELQALGSAYLGSIDPDPAAALAEGVNQFKVSIDDIERLLTEDAWARRNLVFAVAAGQGDGTSGLQNEGGFTALRQRIERLAHVIFSSRPGDAAFWLGEGVLSGAAIEAKYGAIKPCLHGSDAHSSSQLGAPAQDRFTWIKGDPNFAAMSMVRLAPASRVAIGPNPPGDERATRRITRISVPDADWFASEALPINQGLVAIIGARGSGKTALADIVAAAAGSSGPFEDEHTFLKRAEDLLSQTRSKAVASWNDGAETEAALHSPPETSWDEHPVRYLSQKFVEALCSADGVSHALLQEIERVVFEAFPRGERKGATTFGELRDIRTVAARSSQQVHQAEIQRLSAELTELRLLRDRTAALEQQETKLESEVSIRLKAVEALTGAAPAGDPARLLAVGDALEAREDAAQLIDRRLSALRDLEQQVRHFRTTTAPAHLAALRKHDDLVELDSVAWSQFELQFVGDVDGILAKAVADAKGGLDEIRYGGEPPDQEPVDIRQVPADTLGTKSIASLIAERDRLQKLSGMDTQRTKKLRTSEARLRDARSQLVECAKTLERARATAPRIEELMAERECHYRAYFEALLAEEEELNSLYSPLEQVFTSDPGSVSKLKFSVRRRVDHVSWAARGEALLDARRSGEFRGQGSLEKLALAELVPVWETADADGAARALSEFNSKYSSSIRKQALVDPNDGQAMRSWERRVAEWLYDASHVTLAYSLQYDGIDIRRLSPGTRGIVLLLLYLAVDQNETEPMIIDQPEENLDPESIYAELVQLFRKASERRQIIMVTHNANLVVNTDVDQVIVANCDSVGEGRLPTLSYRSGGLDDPAIRKVVCEILEGGEAAFRERARRLGLQWHSE
jgi:energy-coupling factor transporter ATP-binding protein EcfA2